MTLVDDDDEVLIICAFQSVERRPVPAALLAALDDPGVTVKSSLQKGQGHTPG